MREDSLPHRTSTGSEPPDRERAPGRLLAHCGSELRAGHGPLVAGEILKLFDPDRYVTHGKPAVLLEEVGFTAEAVAERTLSALGARVGG